MIIIQTNIWLVMYVQMSSAKANSGVAVSRLEIFPESSITESNYGSGIERNVKKRELKTYEK